MDQTVLPGIPERTDRPGRPASDPQVLLALWVFGTVQGIGSARQLARLCQEHDAYRWIRGGVPVDYHLLADFRVAHEHELNDLLSRVVAAMMAENLVTLERVAQDGMRVRASAGAGSFHGADSLRQCLSEARAQISGPRVSTTDPEARVMHMPDGGFRPAFNVELATDSQSQVIVGVAISNRGTDQGEALPMEAQVAERTGRHPGAYLMDGGFVKREDITALERNGVTVYAPLRPPRTATSGREATTPRSDDSPEVIAWRERMGTDQAKKIYKDRAATAECVNALSRLRGVQQFRVRGLAKTLSVMLLVAITHNLLRWITLAE